MAAGWIRARVLSGAGMNRNFRFKYVLRVFEYLSFSLAERLILEKITSISNTNSNLVKCSCVMNQ